MKSKPPEPTSGSSVWAQNSRTLGSMAFIFRGVNTRRQQAPVEVVVRRVLEDDRPRRDLHPALDQLEDRALGRAVRAPVDQRALDVVEAAEGVEVVALVVVERAARRASASRAGTGRRRSRSRTGRSRGRARWRSSSVPPPKVVTVSRSLHRCHRDGLGLEVPLEALARRARARCRWPSSRRTAPADPCCTAGSRRRTRCGRPGRRRGPARRRPSRPSPTGRSRSRWRCGPPRRRRRRGSPTAPGRRSPRGRCACRCRRRRTAWAARTSRGRPRRAGRCRRRPAGRPPSGRSRCSRGPAPAGAGRPAGRSRWPRSVGSPTGISSTMAASASTNSS